jgi:uncharacterized protein YejL (UPF0352 family)
LHPEEIRWRKSISKYSDSEVSAICGEYFYVAVVEKPTQVEAAAQRASLKK